MRLARYVDNEDTWQRYVEVDTHRHQDTAAPRARAKVQVDVQRTPETCRCRGKEGHNKADCKFQTAMCSDCAKVGHLRAVCRNTNTHEIGKDAWLFEALSTMVTVIALRSTT